MNIGFVYAGQGSQHLGQGQDFYEKYQSVKDTYTRATQIVSPITEMNLAQLSFEGPEEKLSQTRYTQPAMVTFGVAVTDLLLKENIHPAYVCGLSLGEYTALYAAGVIDRDTVISLVAKRGRYMEEAAQGIEVKMSAVLGLDRATVVECCQKVTEAYGGEKICQAVNFNCPGQIVISGDALAVDKASALLKEAGAKRVLALKVSGPFHTSLMKPAGDALAREFESVDFRNPNTGVIFNCLGQGMSERDNIADLLVRQVQSPVYFEDSIRYMADQGVDVIVEIGPGRAMSKLIAKTLPDMPVYSIDKVEDYEMIVKELKA